MCSHFLVEPVACTPASGREKGQAENQVGVIRERFFKPRLRFKSFDELNAWLLDKCVAYAKAHDHQELKEQTIWQVFEAERHSLVPYAGHFPACSHIVAKVGPVMPDLRSFAPADRGFDGFHAVPASVSKTCLVRFDNNRYSIMASAVGRPVEIRAYWPAPAVIRP